MSQPPTPVNRDALRDNLSTSTALRESSLVGIGDINDAARRARANVVVQQQQAPNGFMNGSVMPNLLPSGSTQSLWASQQHFFPHAASAGAAGSSSLGNQHNELLLAVANEREQTRLLEQARAAVIIAQQRERLIMQQSYQNLLQRKLAAGNASAAHPKITDALRHSLFSQGHSNVPASQIARHHPMAQSMKDDSISRLQNGGENATEKALEALGGSLRKSTDPYIDVTSIVDQEPSTEEDARQARRTRGGVTEPFPEKLHRMLEEVAKEGNSEIVSFYSHGRAFAVHDMDRFVAEIMPRFFKQTKWNSFARQLNLYGFQRLLSGPGKILVVAMLYRASSLLSLTRVYFSILLSFCHSLSILFRCRRLLP